MKNLVLSILFLFSFSLITDAEAMTKEELVGALREDPMYTKALESMQRSDYGAAESLLTAGLRNTLKHYEEGKLSRDIPEAYADKLTDLENKFEQLGDWKRVKTAAKSLMDAEKRLYCCEVSVPNVACNKNEYWLNQLRHLAQAQLHLDHPKEAEILYKKALNFLEPQLNKKESPPGQWHHWRGPPPSFVSFKYAICRDYEALLRLEKRNSEADVLHEKEKVFLFPERYP